MPRVVMMGRIPGQEELSGFGRTLAKARTKPKHSIVRQRAVFVVTPDEVIRALEEQGLNITRRTLFNWEKAGLVPEAKCGSYGQGGGKWTDYPEETVPEALTAHLLKGVYQLKHSEIAEARSAYREECLAPHSCTWGATIERIQREGYSRARQTISPFMMNLSKELAAIVTDHSEDSDRLAMALAAVLDFLQSELSWELRRKYEEGIIPEGMSLTEALKVMAETKPEERLSVLLASLLHLLPRDLGWELQRKYEEGVIPEDMPLSEALKILEDSDE